MTKQDARDIRRTLGRAVLEGREPTEREVSEALCLKLIRAASPAATTITGQRAGTDHH